MELKYERVSENYIVVIRGTLPIAVINLFEFTITNEVAVSTSVLHFSDKENNLIDKWIRTHFGEDLDIYFYG